MVYWTLIPHKFSDTIKEAKIKIYSDNAFEDTISVWEYGNYGGHCYVNNGAIYMQSNGKLASDEYMPLLAKFPKGMFNSNNNLNNSFEYYFQKTQDGAKGYQERKQSEKVSKFYGSFYVYCINRRGFSYKSYKNLFKQIFSDKKSNGERINIMGILFNICCCIKC